MTDVTADFFGNDIQFFTSILGKSLVVESVYNKVFTGIAYVIDPSTKTLVLSTKNQSGYSLDFLLSHSIKSVQISNTSTNGEVVFDTTSRTIDLSDDDTNQKRARLKLWLTSNLFDVVEEGQLLKVGDRLFIEPPYGPEQCFCDNTMVLDRVRKLVTEMPVNE